MSERSMSTWWGVAGVAAIALVLVPLVRGDDDDVAAGFNGFVQSGTCADPNDELRVDLETDGDANPVEPYVALDEGGESATLGFYGAPGIPGFGLAAIYTDRRFSMVITDAESGDAVACGDVLAPADDRFTEDGRAVVQLLPVGSSEVQGFALLDRARLERELDITPTRAQIILNTEGVTVPEGDVAGFDGAVQNGGCQAPLDDFRVELETEDDYDVSPLEAISPGSTAPVTVAYYGAAGLPGFGLAAAYTDQDFSVVIEDAQSGDPVACGDLLEPADDSFVDAGLSLVQLLPAGEAGVQGYAIVRRAGMQRELDVTPTAVRVLLFASAAAVE